MCTKRWAGKIQTGYQILRIDINNKANSPITTLVYNRWVSKVEKIEEDSLDSIPITFALCENSNYWKESLLEVIKKDIAGCCQQTFENKK